MIRTLSFFSIRILIGVPNLSDVSAGESDLTGARRPSALPSFMKAGFPRENVESGTRLAALDLNLR